MGLNLKAPGAGRGPDGPRQRGGMNEEPDLWLVLLTVMDLRSFSNLWYWIALAVTWSLASHWVLGLPYDLVRRAAREGGAAEAELRLLLGVQHRRYGVVAARAGAGLIGFAAFWLTTLFTLGFFYGIEFAQALFLLLAPLLLVLALSFRWMRRLPPEVPAPALFRALHRARRITQGIGMAAIFIAALWGMWTNLRLGPY